MKKFLTIILGIIVMICGLVLMFNPITSFGTLGTFIGITVLISGIAQIITWFSQKGKGMSGWVLAGGIISVIFALFVLGDIIFKIKMEMILLYIVAIGFLVHGVFRIIIAYRLKKIGGETGKHWWVALILGILFVIAGIISFANPLPLLITIGMIFGLNMFVCGADLISLSAFVE